MPTKQSAALILTAILSAAPAQAAAPSTALCEKIAKAIPMNSGYDTGRVSGQLLDTVSYPHSGVTWKKSIDDKAVSKDFAAIPVKDPLNIYQFAPQIFVAETVGGTMHCQNFNFLKRENGQFKEIPGPGIEDMCWDDYGRIGTVSSVPALVEENDLSDTHVTLRVMAWENEAWSIPCTIDARFLSALRFDTNYCKGDGCEALGQQALALAARYRNEPGFRKPPANDGGKDALQALAGRKELDLLPTLGITTSNPYETFEDKVAVPVTVGGKRLLAVVGGGSFGWRQYSGYLVAFWRLGEKGAPEPLAGFNIGSYRSAATSIVVSSAAPAKK